MKTPLAIRVVLFCMMIAGVCGVPGMAFADTATTSESTLSETAIAERHAALRERAISSGPIPVIVKLRIDQELETRLDTPGIAAQRQRLADSQVAVLDRLGLRTPLQQSTRAVKRFAITPALAMHVDVADLDALLDDPLVSEVVEDGLEFPALSESVPLIGASSNGDFAGRTGLGQVVAILDSGVTKSHSFLTGKVVSEACYSSTVASSNTTSLCPGGASQSTATDSALDCDLAIASCGHGTHIAGIAAGSGSSFSGVAKDAKIIAMQVYSQANSLVDCYPRSTPCLVTFVSDQIKALERVYALRSSFNIAAANLSLGTGSYSGYCDTDARKPIIDQLRGAGIATVVASGNSGATTATSAPACISSAVSVGSTTKLDAMAASSNSAWFLNLLAPGENIGSSSPPNTYAFRSGTSYSAPHVVGAWAVLKQAKPTGSVDELLNALVSTGKPITDNRSGAGGRVKPRIQLAQAVGQFVTFTLNVSSSGASAVSISADQAIYAGVTNYSKSGIPAGTTITLTAPAAVGYANFTAWSGCDSTSGTSCTLTMNSDRSPTVSYTTPTYSLSVDSSGASTVAITANPSTYAGTTNYSKTGIPAGTTFTLTAPAAVGYTSFSAWSGCDSTSGTSCTLTMTANRTVAVSYVTPSYSLSVDSSGASAVAITAEPSAYAGTTNYSKTGILAGTTVILTAPAMVDSIGFGAWSGCDSTSGTSCTLTMTANRTVTVSYAVASHTLTVSSTGVSGVAISAEPPSYAGITDYSLSDIATGTMITLTAPGTLDSANFSAWSGCDSTSGTSCTLTMAANRTVTVSYTGPIHTLNVRSTGVSGVAISAEPPSYAGITDYTLSDITTGTGITLTAPTTVGAFIFAGWDGCDSAHDNLCAITMLSNKTVIARFVDQTAAAALIGLNPEGLIYYSRDLANWTQTPGVLKQLIAADLDGDGWDDLAGLGQRLPDPKNGTDGDIYYSLDLAQWNRIPGILAQLAAGDLNGDGQADLVGLNSAGLLYYSTDRLQWSNIPGNATKLVVADLDDDGQDDLVALNGQNQIFYTLDLNNWMTIPGALAQLIAADLDGDGTADLVGLNSDGWIYASVDLNGWVLIPGRLAQLSAGDLDGNGEADLIGLNDAGELFYTTNLNDWSSISGTWAALVIADLDGDGRDDIAALDPLGSIFYTLDLNNWINIPGSLDQLTAGML